MKLKSLRIRGIGRFHEETSLPLEELGDAQLVAVVGDNGEGKTTLLESFPGALYRSMPSRGALAAMATDRDSMVEAVVETDQVYTARLLVNGVVKTPKTEAYLIDGNDRPINDGKTGTYEAEIAKRFPSRDLVLASVFAAQTGEGSFLDVAPARRRELFAEMLGIGRLQELSDAAGKRASQVDVDLTALRARVAAIEEQTARLLELRDGLRAATKSADLARRDREAAEQLLAAARAALDQWREERSSLERCVADVERAAAESRHRLDAASTEVRRTQADLAKLAGRSADIAARLEQRAGLEETVARGRSSETSLADVEAKAKALREQRDKHVEALAEWNHRKAAADRELERAESAHQRAADKAISDHRAAFRELEAAERAAGGLSDVPCGGDGEYATCPLIASATAARGRLDALRERATELEEEVEAARVEPKAVTDARAAVQALGDPPGAPDTSKLQQLEAQAEAIRKQLQELVQARAKLEALVDVAEEAEKLDREAAELRQKLTKARRSEGAADMAFQAAHRSVRDAQSNLEAHDERRPEAPDDGALRNLRASETQAVAAVAAAREAVTSAERAAEQLSDVRAEIAETVTHLDDWKHLQEALGRRGVQALEIDAASPEVSSITNELLHACYGSRFSVALETTKLKADGKGSKEIVDLRVLDTERGTDGSASLLSGGEKVLVGEALSLAIAIYNSRRSHVPLLDLFRDECAGALSSGNAQRYIEMLRRALDVGGFHRCYFVAHQPQLWDLADRIIEVSDGGCRVVDGADVTITVRAPAVEEAA